MHKFSVVIPTIWKSDYIHNMLDRYYMCPNIDEVILINNNRENTPNFSRHEKLLYIEPHENIYVNPAWNLGIRISKNNNVIVSNDDMLYDVNEYTNIITYFINQFGSLSNIGMIGIHENNYKLEKTLDQVELTRHQGKPAWACLFTIDKNDWKNIPEQLKIYYGDDYLKMKLGNKIFDLIGFKVESVISSSADTKIDWVKRVTDMDREEWNKLLLTR